MSKFLIFFFIILCSNVFGQKMGNIIIDNNITLSWEIQNFDKSKHTFEYCQENELKYLCKIDNQVWFGSDRGLEFPKNELTKLVIRINDKNIKLETSKMFNPNFSGELFKSQFRLKKVNEIYILYAFFSDGAGSYSAHWKIENGLSKRIVLSNDEEFF